MDKDKCPHCGRSMETNVLPDECPFCHADFMEPAPTYPPETKIGGYIVKKLLGEGGMGEVYLAEQTSMRRPVALKILQGKLSEDAKYLERFFREVRMLAQIEHPNVVSAIEAGVDNGICFFSMAYVPGKDIKQMLDEGHVISEFESIRIVEKAAIALEYVWRKYQLIHRDVKPANIMLTPEGDVKLMDLGISKTASERNDLTMAGMMVGSPTYVSPEQARAEKDLDFRADMYSLAASYYHMITGEPPYEAENPMGVISRHLSDPIPDPRALKPEISLRSHLLIQRMMAKKKSARFNSWEEALAEIRGIREDSAPPQSETTFGSPLPSRPEKKHHASPSLKKKNLLDTLRTSHRMISLIILLILFLMAFGAVVRKSLRDAQNKKVDLILRRAQQLAKDCPQKERASLIRMLEEVQRSGDEEQSQAARKELLDFRKKLSAEKLKIEEEKKERALQNLKKKSDELELDKKFLEARSLWEHYAVKGEYKDDPLFLAAMKKSLDYLSRKQKDLEDGILPE